MELAFSEFSQPKVMGRLQALGICESLPAWPAPSSSLRAWVSVSKQLPSRLADPPVTPGHHAVGGHPSVPVSMAVKWEEW